MRWQLTLLSFLVVLLIGASIHVGLRVYTPDEVWTALLRENDTPEALIITGLRIPRTMAALIVGAALGLSGLLMQAVLRNPLAEPGLLGVNAGASFAVVFAFSILGLSSFLALSIFALLGAGGAMAVIFVLIATAKGTLNPTSLILVGVTVAAFLSSFTQVLIVTDEGTMEALLFWLAGGFADRGVLVLSTTAPIILIGVVIAVFAGSALDAMAAGDETARSLGVDTLRLRILTLTLASVLAGLCVVIAGPVGFVGLVAPHLARLLGHHSHIKLLPRVALLGSCVTLAADIVARRIVMPQEVPVTATLALIGAPILVGLIRLQKLRTTA